MSVYTCREGDSPLLLSMPHSGTELSAGLTERLTPAALQLPDTDWYVPRLYEFASDLDATIVQANYSRYVIDLNRPPDNTSLYPGQAGTGLCPTVLFDGQPLYINEHELKPEEIDQRRQQFWRPYHDRLSAELNRIKARHGYAILYDCHSIASRVPRLFEGVLPVLNLGTVHGQSCAPDLQQPIESILAASEYTTAVNGRFVGGYITRHYGQPEKKLHALQMEIGQDSYISHHAYDPDKAKILQRVLRNILQALNDWRPA